MSGPEQIWRDALADGRLMLPRETTSGRYFFPPRIAAPGNGASWEWAEASGRGTVYSVSIVHPRLPEQAYNVVLVDLAEGPRLMSRVEGMAPEAVTIGMAVTARIATTADGPLLLFDPA